MSEKNEYVDSRVRVLLDSCMANETKNPQNLFGDMDHYTSFGIKFVALSKDVPYIRAFQKSPDEFEQLVKEGKLIVKPCYPATETSEQGFDRFFGDKFLHAHKSFEGVLKGLQNAEAIEALKARIEKLEDQSEDFAYDSWQELRLVPTEIRNKVGLPVEASRLYVLKACIEREKISVFRAYNKFYIKGLAIRYKCDYAYHRNGLPERIF